MGGTFLFQTVWSRNVLNMEQFFLLRNNVFPFVGTIYCRSVIGTKIFEIGEISSIFGTYDFRDFPSTVYEQNLTP